MEQRFNNCEGDQKKLIFSHTFRNKKITVLPEYTSSFTLASSINMFSIEKIKIELSVLDACLPAYLFVEIDIIIPVCTAVFDTFQPVSSDVLSSIIH